MSSAVISATSSGNSCGGDLRGMFRQASTTSSDARRLTHIIGMRRAVCFEIFATVARGFAKIVVVFRHLRRANVFAAGRGSRAQRYSLALFSGNEGTRG